MINSKISSAEIMTLRLALIGNEDLKHKLVNDPVFISDLVSAIVAKLESQQDISDELTILRFLVTFSHTNNPLVTDSDFTESLGGIFEKFFREINANLFEHRLPDAKVVKEVVELINLVGATKRFEILKFVLIVIELNSPELLYVALDLIPSIIDSNNEEIVLKKLVGKLENELGKGRINIIFKLLVNLNYVLDEAKIKRYGLELDKVNELTELLKQNHKLLSLNVINLLYYFNIDYNFTEELIELIDNEEIATYSINPAKILSNLIISQSINETLFKHRIDLRIIEYLKRNVNPDFNLKDILYLGDIFLLISLLVNNSERARVMFVYKYDFKTLIVKLLHTYKNILIKGTNPYLMNHKLFVNLLNMLRSLSRSTHLLRTFFNELNSVELLIEISKLVHQNQLNIEINLIIMSVFANLILDFSSFRYDLVKNDQFFEHLLNMKQHQPTEESVDTEKFNLVYFQIIKNLMYNENEENKIRITEAYFRLDTFLPVLKIKSFQNTEIDNIKILQRVIIFDIFRNLTSNSSYFHIKLKDLVESNFSVLWHDFLILNATNLFVFNPKLTVFHASNIKKIINDKNYVNLMMSINYIINHSVLTSTNNEVIISHKMFKIWRIFLNMRINNNNLNGINLSIIWILINLTWQDKTFNLKLDKGEDNIVDFSDVIDRVNYLETLGYFNLLELLLAHLQSQNSDKTNDSVNDLAEKISSVLVQVDSILRPKKEVNRGGEGFGYELDEYVDAEDIEQDDDDDDDIDDYWVR